MTELTAAVQDSAPDREAGDNPAATLNLGRHPLFQEIQRRIRTYIFAQGLKPGEMLPSAAEMANYLGVSAASLREGLRAMEALGMLETRHGVGTFVCSYNLTPIFESLSFSLFFDNDGIYKLIQIRQAMEIGLIHEVLNRIAEDDLQALEELCRQGAQMGWNKELDMQFHRRLYQCLDNELIAHILDIYWMTSAKLVDSTAFTQLQRQTDWQIHRQIVDALQTRNANAAVASLQLHFTSAAVRFRGDA
jgi:DNA-binding FadR family transcriptional regulator